MTTLEEKLKDWDDLTVDNFFGGLVLDADSEVLEKNEFVEFDSYVIRDKRVKRDTGYTPYLGPVLGHPRRQVAYILPNGTIHEILITDTTVYRAFNGQWQYVSSGTSTTLNANEAGGSTAINVTSIVGFADNDPVGIMLDTGQMHFSQVNGAPAAGIINIDDPLPSPATSGNAIVKSVALSGVSSRHVTVAVIPWNEWLVFTNGINNVKRFDPAALTVIDVPGLPANTTCQTLALYDNSLLIGNTTEGGVRFPFRYRYSAKGDATNWTTLEAGYTDILDSAHDIIQMLGLGPYLILYRDKSIARISISNSGTKRFDNVTTIAGVGIFSTLGVVDLIDKHIVWGNDDFYWYRGGFSIEPIGSPIKDHVFGKAGLLTHVEQTRGEAFAVLFPKTNEVLFLHHVDPGADHPNLALRYFLDYNKWAHRTFGDTFSGFGTHILAESKTWADLESWEDLTSSWAAFEGLGEALEIVLLGSDTNQSFIYDYETSTDDGVDITAIAETKDFAHPSLILRHSWVDVGLANGSTIVEVSLNKGDTWLPMGVVLAPAKTTKYRLYRDFASRTFRYRFTTIDPVTLVFLNAHFKYEYEN
jgi:hypothetical protein